VVSKSKKDSKKSNKKKLFLIDGNGLAYRAFYAVVPIHTESGVPINALAGFVNMVLRLLKSQKPTHVAVAFDKGIPTERVSPYQDYNAQRVEMPEDLALQLPMIEDFVRALGVPVFRVSGHEADDCIGTLANLGGKAEMDVLILSGDLDLLQLVSPKIKVLTTRRGISDMVIYDEKEVKRRFNLKPAQLADLRALAGDSSDNITGVPGIGEVTAKKLLAQHGRLEDLLRNLSALPAKWRNPLTEHREEAIEFKTRASIRTDLDLDVDWDKCAFRGIPVERVGEIYARTELDKVLEALPEAGEPGSLPSEEPVEVQLVKGKKAKAAVKKYLASVKKGLGLLYLGAVDELVGFAMAADDQTPMVVSLQEAGFGLKDFIKLMEPVLTNKSIRVTTHNIRGLMMTKEGDSLANFEAEVLDIGIASHLLNARDGNPWLDEVAKSFGYEIPGEGELLGHGGGYRKLSDVPLEELADWSARRVSSLNALGADLKSELEAKDLWKQYSQVEFPLIPIISKMERDEVSVDLDVIEDFLAKIDELVKGLEESVYEEANLEFDIEDQKELAEVLFDKMALAVSARPKNGALIGLDILNQIAEQNHIGALLRDHRELKGLKQSFLGARGHFKYPRSGWLRRASQFSVLSSERLLWMGPVTVGGAVSTFNRLLCEVNNLPNPEHRLLFRNLLLSSLKAKGKSNVLLGLTINQFQLRLAAHLSEDPALQKALIRGEDLEGQLLAKLLPENTPDDTPDSRRDLVDTLLGSIGEHRLARRAGLTPPEADEQIRGVMDLFLASFPKMESYISGQQELVAEQGWVSSVGGRRRFVPEMSSRNSDIRTTAERVARNTAIQNSAADLLKLFLVELSADTDKELSSAKLVGQVRDELVFEVPKKSAEAIAAKLMKKMEDTISLSVPVVPEVRIGPDWAAAEELKLTTSSAR
jgi:DNA polymerase I